MNNLRAFINSIPPVVKNILAINIILWLATIAAPGIFMRFGINAKIEDFLGMHYWASDKFSPAQMFTYMFMHANFMHMFFNMFAVYMFGAALETLWGPKRFLFYYLLTGVGAAVVQQLFWTVEYQSLVTAMNEAISANSGQVLVPFEGELMKYFRLSNLQAFDATALLDMKAMFVDAPITVGASGAVFGLLLAFGWLFPQAELFMMFIPVPIKARVAVTIYAVVELFFGVAGFSGDNIAHFAHLGGMLFGIIIMLFWQKKRFR